MTEQQFDAERVIKEFGGVCKTRDGQTVTQLHLFSCAADQFYPLFGVVNGAVMFWTADGRRWDARNEGRNDLIMPRHVVGEWFVLLGEGSPLLFWDHSEAVGEMYPGDVMHVVRAYSDNTIEAEVVE